MPFATSTFHILYVSRLARDCNATVFKQIVGVSRENNHSHGISGALLFDGERFAQLIEGAAADVRPLMRTIEVDLRHTDVRVLFAGQGLDVRLLPRWRTGYCEPTALDVFDATPEPSGRVTIDLFMRLVSQADMA